MADELVAADVVGERADGGYFWVAEGGEEAFDPAGPDLGVGVEEDNCFATGLEDADIAAFAEAGVFLIEDQFDCRFLIAECSIFGKVLEIFFFMPRDPIATCEGPRKAKVPRLSLGFSRRRGASNAWP